MRNISRRDDNGNPIYITYFQEVGMTHENFADGVEYWEWPGFTFRITGFRRKVARQWVYDPDEPGVMISIKHDPAEHDDYTYEYEIADFAEYMYAVNAWDAGRPYDASRHGDYRQRQTSRRRNGRQRIAAQRDANRRREADTEHAKQLDEVAGLLAKQTPQRDIARHLDVSPRTVRRLIDELKQAGRSSVSDSLEHTDRYRGNPTVH